jgi:hypothetical protein
MPKPGNYDQLLENPERAQGSAARKLHQAHAVTIPTIREVTRHQVALIPDRIQVAIRPIAVCGPDRTGNKVEDIEEVGRVVATVVVLQIDETILGVLSRGRRAPSIGNGCTSAAPMLHAEP